MDKKLIPIIIVIIGLASIGIGIALYLTNPQTPQQVIKTSVQPTTIPTPSPTPIYFGLAQREPNFSGVIESIESPQKIVVARQDGTKAELQLTEGIPVYVIKGWQTAELPIIETVSADLLTIGKTLSIYTENQHIIALFITQT